MIYSYCKHAPPLSLSLSCCETVARTTPKCEMCFRYSRLIKLTSVLLNIKQYATPLQSILVILPGPKHQRTYENFYGYTKILYIARFEVLTAIGTENSSLMGCDVMLCHRASVFSISVLL